MKATLILEGTPEGCPIVAEVAEVVTLDGERLELAGLAVASRHVAAQDLGREADGLPVYVYTTSATSGGSA